MDTQRGYVGLTDPEWYAFLAKQPRVDEVNFWQPHGGRAFRAISRGEPFFFKLRAPLKGIAGFGFFERYEALPAWLAWECFGVMNGAPDFASMTGRIVRLRGSGDGITGNFQIGCVMITAPVFFAQEEWVDPPSDWPNPASSRARPTQRIQERAIVCYAIASITHRTVTTIGMWSGSRKPLRATAPPLKSGHGSGRDCLVSPSATPMAEPVP